MAATQPSSLRQLARASYVKALAIQPLWRYVMNTVPTIEYRRHPSELGTESARVLADLNRDGVARSSLEALTGDPTLLGRLQAEAYRLENLKKDELEERARKLANADTLVEGTFNKLFVMTMLDADRPEVRPDDLLAQLALDKSLKGVADGYYGMRTRVSDVNIWRNLPSEHEAVSSQLWHRDLLEDHLILKMFIYLEDVVPGAGPFSYVKGTHGKGNRSWKPEGTIHDGHNVRATADTMAAVIPEENRPTFPGPAGTVLFADTTGWHKGGEAKTASRFLVQTTWSSFASLPDRRLAAPADVDLTTAPKELGYAK